MLLDRYPRSIFRSARRTAIAAALVLGAPLATAQENATQGPDPVLSKPPGLAQSGKLPTIIVAPPAAKHKFNTPPKRKRTSAPAAPLQEPPIAAVTNGVAIGSVNMSPVTGSELPIGKVPAAISTVTGALPILNHFIERVELEEELTV